MKITLIAALMGAAIAVPATAQEITQFNIGILGGENAQDRMTNNECLRKYAE